MSESQKKSGPPPDQLEGDHGTASPPNSNTDNEQETPKAAALRLANLGYAVFPARVVWYPNGKKDFLPQTGGESWKTHSSADPEVVRTMDWGWAATHAAIDCGKSGLFVVDLDVKDGNNGFEDWRVLCEQYDEPDPQYRFATRNGGAHLLYRELLGYPSNSSVGKNGGVAPGIDIRTGVGVVIAHEAYRSVPKVDMLPTVPKWLVKLNTRAVTRDSQTNKPTLASLLGLPSNDPSRGNNWLTSVAGGLATEIEDFDLYLTMVRAADQGSDDPQPEFVVDGIAQRVWNLEQQKKAADSELLQHILAHNEVLEARRLAKENGSKLQESQTQDISAVDAMFAELLDSDALGNIKPTKWLIKGVLPQDCVIRMVGAPASLKSFIAIDMAAHIGGGLPWCEFNTDPGPVIILAAEGSGGIAKRVRAWEHHYERRMDGVFILPRPIQTNTAPWDVLVEVCKRVQPVLVIVDTQAKVTVGKDENSNTDMSMAYASMDRIRTETGSSVMVIHHPGHNSDRARGASSILGAIDVEMLVKRKKESMTTTLSCMKQKDAEEFSTLAFEATQIVLGTDEDGDAISSLALSHNTKIRGVALASIEKAARIEAGLEESASVLQVRNSMPSNGTWVTKSEIAERAGVSTRTVQKVMNNEMSNQIEADTRDDGTKVYRYIGNKR